MATAKKTEEVKTEDVVVEQEVIETPVVTTEAAEEKSTAKAGKRSAKSLKEAEAKVEKEERKESGEEAQAKPKQHANPTRTRLERRGKHFKKSMEAVDSSKYYSLEEAVKTAKASSHVKFDATVELHINLGVDPRHADQNIRDSLLLPAGTGNTIKIAVLTDDEAAAKSAGADICGAEAVFAELEKGNMNFDILISTPALMAKLGKYARILGPRGLMPNPKSGTVTNDIVKAIKEAKAGRVEYRVDSSGIVHMGVGKVSFDDAKLLENLNAIIASIKANKPSSVKGNYFKNIYLTTSMGPSVKVDLSAVA